MPVTNMLLNIQRSGNSEKPGIAMGMFVHYIYFRFPIDPQRKTNWLAKMRLPVSTSHSRRSKNNNLLIY